MLTEQLLEQYPAEITIDRKALARAIDAAVACSQACTACADACLSEDDVAASTRCIRDDLDCADVCSTTSRVLSRHTGYDARLTRAVLEACVQACETCADSCAEHRATTPTARRARTRAGPACAPARRCSTWSSRATRAAARRAPPRPRAEAQPPRMS